MSDNFENKIKFVLSKESDSVSSFLCVASVSLSHTSNTVSFILLTLGRRQFELLQLEINTGSVRDILQQKPLQATCQSLREITHVEVRDKHGTTLDKTKSMSDYFLSCNK